jgi:hypothetical protein
MCLRDLSGQKGLLQKCKALPEMQESPKLPRDHPASNL